MTPFASIQGPLALLDRNNVDTDAILPKQFMKSINRSGFGPHAFDEWRYLDAGELGMDCSKRPLNPDFELNQPRFQQAPVLLTRANFGCGSSREHAPWALLEYGFKAIIAESFADIFRANCLKNGLLVLTLDKPVIDQLFSAVKAQPGFAVDVDLQACTVRSSLGMLDFVLESSTREKLLNGWDDIELTLKHAAKIRAYETSRRQEKPWMFS